MFSEGIYKARAVEWGWDETKNANDTFWMRFAVLGEADPDKPNAPVQPCATGTGRWSITVSKAENAEWLIRTVQHLGYAGDSFSALDPDAPNAFDFTGKEFFVGCKVEEFEGRSREKWTVITPPQRTKSSSSRLHKLDAEYGAKFQEQRAKRNGKAVPATAKAALPY